MALILSYLMMGRDYLEGQLQRIALARLLYTNPELIVLDESTNAVDQETENLIMNNLFKNYSSKTIIIISHRDFYKLNFNKHYSIINNKIERNTKIN